MTTLAQTALLQSIEAHNTHLLAARDANRALMADLRAENRPGETSVEYSPFYQRGVSGTSSSELIVSQEFDFPTLYAARTRQANAQQQALDLQYAILRRDVLLQAQQLAYDLVTARQSRQLLLMRHQAADSLLLAFQHRLEQGDATLIDVNRIRMDRMAVSTDLVRNEAEIQSLLLSLQSLNGGQPIDQDLLSASLTDDLTPPSPLEPGSMPTGSLELTASQQELQVTQHELRIAQQSWLPSLTLGYRRNTELREAQNGMLLGVSIPLFSNTGKVKAARLRRSAAEYELEGVEHEQQARYETLQSRALQLHHLLETYDEALLRQQLTLLRHAVSAGELSVIDYFTESDRIYSLLQERIQTQNEYRKTEAEIYRDRL